MVVDANLISGTVKVNAVSVLDVTGFVNEWRGTSGNDSFIGSAGDEHFITEGGNNFVDGGDGFDTVGYDRYGVSELKVEYTGQGTATVTGFWNGVAFVDDLIHVERVRGARGGTTEFISSNGNEHFDARGGVNLFSFSVGSGQDTIHNFVLGSDKIDVAAFGLYGRQRVPRRDHHVTGRR